jgi:hypothetical protein
MKDQYRCKIQDGGTIRKAMSAFAHLGLLMEMQPEALLGRPS